MALQKKPRQVQKKKRVLNSDGTYESGKKIGRPGVSNKVEVVRIRMDSDFLDELKTLAILHYRGNVSQLIRSVLERVMPEIRVLSDKANAIADAKRGHVDLIKIQEKKRRRSRKVAQPVEDLGFEVV